MTASRDTGKKEELEKKERKRELDSAFFGHAIRLPDGCFGLLFFFLSFQPRPARILTREKQFCSPTLSRSTSHSRVLLKLSGEALAGDAGTGVDPSVLASVAADVAAAVRAGVEVAVVVGGGNYYRGAEAASSKKHQSSVDRATGDYVGMLATVMNALLLQGALERAGVATRVQTAIEMRQIAEPYIRRRAMRHLERGRVVIFGAGTGNPFFTTDSAAALRAAEVGADALLKATKVDGVFDRDPSGADGAGAVLLRSLSYADVASKKLAVMDGTAVTLAAENGIDCVVFNMRRPGHVERALLGDPSIGTSISNGDVVSSSSSSSSSSSTDGGSPSSPSNSAAAARELMRAPTVTKGGAAWRGGVGVESDSDEGPSVGC